MNRLLVTGGCGFIGSNFIHSFMKSHPDWKIRNLDALTYCGNRENVRALEGRDAYEFIQGDICDEAAVRGAVEGVAAVVHFAAETHVDRSIDASHDFLSTNILGTRNLLEAARQAHVKRFLHISTDEVYGSIQEGSVDEEARLLPNSPYAASKAAADLLVRAYWKTHHYPAVVVRSSNNFGPYQFPEKVIPLFVTNLLENKKVPLYGTGQNRRQWIYVEDNCRAIELILEKGEDNSIYNIGVGNEMSNEELTRKILRAMARDEGMIQFVKDRPGHDFRYAIKAERLQKLGFQPRWNFEQALKKTVEWYEKNRSWWQPLKQDKFTLK